jgi:hypothetical protein
MGSIGDQDAPNSERAQWEARALAAEHLLEGVIAERDAFADRLPAEMKECTILFKECEKGHGRLTATNWVDHGCPWCLIAAIREIVRRD